MKKNLDRREFIVIGAEGVCAGFALAVLPVSAWAITTPSDGILTAQVSIPTQGGQGSQGSMMPGYVAHPKGKGPFPAVLVIHEIFGVHEYIQDVCRRFAKQGYLAVSPYLYFRQGDVTKLTSIDEIREKVISKVSQAQYLADLDATVKWAVREQKADPERLGITGFCWGGTVVWMYSAHNPKIKAGVAWYGKLTGTASELTPRFPLDIATELKAPVLGLYGGKDQGIPQADVEKMRAKLKPPSQIIVYPEADHGFHADYRPSYHEASAREGWSKALGWFKRNGVA